MRETWEEVGLDLAERDYVYVGQLDDREITTSLGKRLLMILSPHGPSRSQRSWRNSPWTLFFFTPIARPVFLHTSPECPTPDLQPAEVASAHWVSLSLCERLLGLTVSFAVFSGLTFSRTIKQCTRLKSVGAT
jgi:8-oxo-dGTP pyrophosphatase MutT (NUDIX family)